MSDHLSVSPIFNHGDGHQMAASPLGDVDRHLMFTPSPTTQQSFLLNTSPTHGPMPGGLHPALHQTSANLANGSAVSESMSSPPGPLSHLVAAAGTGLDPTMNISPPNHMPSMIATGQGIPITSTATAHSPHPSSLMQASGPSATMPATLASNSSIESFSRGSRMSMNDRFGPIQSASDSSTSKSRALGASSPSALSAALANKGGSPKQISLRNSDSPTPTASVSASSGSSGGGSKPRISRVSQACDWCRRRKRRCDGNRPCSTCIEQEIACLYTRPVKKRGPPTGGKKLKEQAAQAEKDRSTRDRKSHYQQPQQQTGQKADEMLTGSAEARNASVLLSGIRPSASNLHSRSSSSSSSSSSEEDEEDEEEDIRQPSKRLAPSSGRFPPASGGAGTAPAQRLADATFIVEMRNNPHVETLLERYFCFANDTLFPFLQRQTFDSYRHQFLQLPIPQIPPFFVLQYASVVAIAAIAFENDKLLANQAANVARLAAIEVAHESNAEVLRGLLLLSFFTLSCNQQNKAACYLSICHRLCSQDSIRNQVGPEVCALSSTLENMLCSVNWWAIGLDRVPQGAHRRIQQEQYPQHKQFYLQLLAYYEKLQKFGSVPPFTQLNTPPTTPPPNPTAHPTPAANTATSSSTGSQATPPSPASPPAASSSTSNSVSVSSASSPPVSSASPDATTILRTIMPPGLQLTTEEQQLAGEILKIVQNLRSEMLDLQTDWSFSLGKFEENPPFSLYRVLIIATIAEHISAVIPLGPIKIIVLFFKALSHRLLGDEDMMNVIRNLPNGEKSLVNVRCSQYYAHQCSYLSMQTEVNHTCFFAVIFHVVGQLHLSTNDDHCLAIDLEVLERITDKWEYGHPICHNLKKRIANKLHALQQQGVFQHATTNPFAKLLASYNPALLSPKEDRFEPEIDLSSDDLRRAARIYHACFLPAISDAPPDIAATVNSISDDFRNAIRITDQPLMNQHTPNSQTDPCRRDSFGTQLTPSSMANALLISRTRTPSASAFGFADGTENTHPMQPIKEQPSPPQQPQQPPVAVGNPSPSLFSQQISSRRNSPYTNPAISAVTTAVTSPALNHSTIPSLSSSVFSSAAITNPPGMLPLPSTASVLPPSASATVHSSATAPSTSSESSPSNANAAYFDYVKSINPNTFNSLPPHLQPIQQQLQQAQQQLPNAYPAGLLSNTASAQSTSASASPAASPPSVNFRQLNGAKLQEGMLGDLNSSSNNLSALAAQALNHRDSTSVLGLPSLGVAGASLAEGAASFQANRLSTSQGMGASYLLSSSPLQSGLNASSDPLASFYSNSTANQSLNVSMVVMNPHSYVGNPSLLSSSFTDASHQHNLSPSHALFTYHEE